VLEWAFAKGERMFFFPDQHLGRNTAVEMGLDPDADMVVWDPREPFGGTTPEALERSKVILWKGHCSVHGRFTVDQIERARREHPGINVIVHPECTLDVVRAADLNGSTEYIIKQIEAAPAGTKWAVGTEINLVSRLQQEHPDKLIFCLDPVICPCSTMYRIHPHYLLWVLENLAAGKIVNQIKVKPEIKQWARVSLQRMLDIS
jgi:quinolinate synthase